MRAGLAVLIMVGIAIPRLARAQADADALLEIPVHPDVTTILHLPDEVRHARFHAPIGGLMASKIVDDMLIMQPRDGTPAGTVISLEVKTATVRRRFRLRVTERARDAMRDVVVPADPAPEPPPVVPAELMAPPTAVLPAVEEPASTPTAAPDPAPAEPVTAEDTEPATTAASAPRFDITAHAVAGLGVTGLDVADYAPEAARRAHQALRLRLTVEPPGRLWSLQADVGAELPAGPLRFRQQPMRSLQVTGARLQAELGVRLGVGTTWVPSFYGAIGVQAHLRRDVRKAPNSAPQSSEILDRGGVLALGIGLRYRAGVTLLGVDFQVRQGWPDDYFSVVGLISVGRLLDQGE